jgi:N-acetylneuraminate synthase
LEKIAQTGKPLILSSGMSSLQELDETVAFLKSKNVDFSMVQCTTAYPTQPVNYGLNMIQELRNRYKVSVGFSDHSAKIETCIAAVALGAEIIEFHVVFDKRMFGPDSQSSLTIEETATLVKAIRNIEVALQNPVDKNNTAEFTSLKNIFEKSLAVNKNLKAGHLLTFNDLEAKKPKGYGIDAAKFQEIIGKVLVKDLKQWDFLSEDVLDTIPLKKGITRTDANKQ